MRQNARQHLEAQLQRLAQQREDTKQKLRALARQTQQEQRYRQGEYVELAGLAHVDPATLLGGLRELATLLTDPDRMARWKAQGEIWLEAHRRRNAHRGRQTSSADDGICHMETQATQA